MLEAILKRRACRSFDKEKEVEQYKIDEIVQAGLLAPSGMNRQTPVIIVIKDKETRDKLMNLNRDCAAGRFPAHLDPFYNAPVVILVIAHKNGLSLLDGGATMENMLIEATNQGLASAWIHRADDEIKTKEGKELLSFTGLNLDEYVGIGHVILGYPKDWECPEKVIKNGRKFEI